MQTVHQYIMYTQEHILESKRKEKQVFVRTQNVYTLSLVLK